MMRRVVNYLIFGWPMPTFWFMDLPKSTDLNVVSLRSGKKGKYNMRS